MATSQRDELVRGLFDLRSHEPILVHRHPTDRYLHLGDTPLDRVFHYAFGCEGHRRLLVQGPGARLREFGVAADHDAFWAAYVRDIGPMRLGDPDRPSGYSGDKWPMPWIEWRPEHVASLTAGTPANVTAGETGFSDERCRATAPIRRLS